jgi:hypothetical protein
MSISPDDEVQLFSGPPSADRDPTAPPASLEFAHVGHDQQNRALGHTVVASGRARDLQTRIPVKPVGIPGSRWALAILAGTGAYLLVFVVMLFIPPANRTGLGLVAIVLAVIVGGRVARARNAGQWAQVTMLSIVAIVFTRAILMLITGSTP